MAIKGNVKLSTMYSVTVCFRTLGLRLIFLYMYYYVLISTLESLCVLMKISMSYAIIIGDLPVGARVAMATPDKERNLSTRNQNVRNKELFTIMFYNV